MDEVYEYDEFVKRYIERKIVKMIEEMQKEYEKMEELFDKRLEELQKGFIEPMVSISDMGDKYIVIIDIAGIKGNLDVKVEPTRVVVEGYLDERFAEEAFGDLVWGRRVKRVYGEYQLPEPVDVEKIVLERKDKIIVIIAPKKLG